MTGQKKETRGEIVLYQAPDGKVELNIRLERESLWLSQKQMSLLFDKDTDTVGLHLRNIYKEGELEESATTEESSVVQKEGNQKVWCELLHLSQQLPKTLLTMKLEQVQSLHRFVKGAKYLEQ